LEAARPDPVRESAGPAEDLVLGLPLGSGHIAKKLECHDDQCIYLHRVGNDVTVALHPPEAAWFRS
jgi:hypothetical protein